MWRAKHLKTYPHQILAPKLLQHRMVHVLVTRLCIKVFSLSLIWKPLEKPQLVDKRVLLQRVIPRNFLIQIILFGYFSCSFTYFCMTSEICEYSIVWKRPLSVVCELSCWVLAQGVLLELHEKPQTPQKATISRYCLKKNTLSAWVQESCMNRSTNVDKW